MTEQKLKQTSLNAAHRDLGGRMVDFEGWDMPVQYPAGTIAEHLRTREHCGLFDVSHMGEIHVVGKDAIEFVNYLTTNDVSNLVDGQAHYSALTYENGTVVDDLLVYRFGPEKLFLVVNAGTQDKDWEWIESHKADFDVETANASNDYCQIAIQGPEAESVLQKLTDTELSAIKYYHFEEGEVDGVEAIISRTGYTGEDGFEVYAASEMSRQLWDKMLEAGGYGSDTGILPCGLAARNTLRLESAMSLYGHELSDKITPLEANLGWICKLKTEFIGCEALRTQKKNGLDRKLIGFEMTDRGIARDGYDVYSGEEKIGVVTSGSPAPFLKKNIGLAFVPPEMTDPGREIQIDVRGRRLAAEIVKTPFYRREK
ncbi:MAG: glycine cleavage system aminomethyltransferase GcvT [Acidobacteria bacterium]|nr:MAG: glycine cleavage system aminomethyltransferase GcvT [Acidobacteriota bacterium]REK01202.1 MAG: glycine cleavage system aminomethyltransferase GcvT [Acidobacteriota bacterium]REK14158.1 MAG: glycine cleavage system aminomethyltransferase GcvT [Acidobacteriota bacterium]REK44873.1 MAG: glycine cleavage system aminomethyltransferase GcvT [Acidobacteriota bacterium]